jgi:hypothetical protein
MRSTHGLSLMLRPDALEHGAHIDRVALADGREVVVEPARHDGTSRSLVRNSHSTFILEEAPSGISSSWFSTMCTRTWR